MMGKPNSGAGNATQPFTPFIGLKDLLDKHSFNYEDLPAPFNDRLVFWTLVSSGVSLVSMALFAWLANLAGPISSGHPFFIFQSSSSYGNDSNSFFLVMYAQLETCLYFLRDKLGIFVGINTVYLAITSLVAIYSMGFKPAPKHFHVMAFGQIMVAGFDTVTLSVGAIIVIINLALWLLVLLVNLLVIAIIIVVILAILSAL